MRMLKISSVDDLIANSMNILEPNPVDADGNEREDGKNKFFYYKLKVCTLFLLMTLIAILYFKTIFLKLFYFNLLVFLFCAVE